MKILPKLALAIVLTTLNIAPTFAATFTVNNTDDSGSGSLREAIDSANNTFGDDVIDFFTGLAGQTINLNSPINIFDNLNINGLGADVLTVSGDNTDFNILTIDPDTTVGILGLNFIQGSVGILNEGTATVSSSTFSSNFLGILNYGTATVDSSTFINNLVGITSSGTATIDSSTFSNNYFGIENFSTVTVDSSTFSDSAIGILNLGTTTINNSTIRENDIGIDNTYGTLNTENVTFVNNGVDIIPVPEPSAILGLAGLGLFCLLRKKVKAISE